MDGNKPEEGPEKGPAPAWCRKTELEKARVPARCRAITRGMMLAAVILGAIGLLGG